MTSARRILAANVARLMAYDVELKNQDSLRKRAKIGGGTLDGILSGKHSPTLDSIEKLANAFGLRPYQLLIPDLDPRQPAKAHVPTNEAEFFADIQRLLQQKFAEYKAKDE